ncbi:MAG: EAL domain-containing protein [Chromatiaceae bacterium]|nr:EAL domain-containing protein [Chromatiaceae bacterium]
MSAVHPKTPLTDEPAIHTAHLEQLFRLQRDALEMIALGRATDEILDQLCRLSEELLPNSVASIMLLDPTRNQLHVRSAPSIPSAAVAVLNGLQPGPNAGSCGTAVFRNEPVFIDNVLTDKRWSGMLDIAQQFMLQACWSMPIKASEGIVIGSFALTSFERRSPDPFHRRLLDTASYLAGIVLEREVQAQRLRTAGIAFEHMREGVMVTDAACKIVQVNQGFERITGYSATEAIGQTPRLLNSGRQDSAFYRDFYRALDKQGEWCGEIWNRRKNGDIYPQWLSVKRVNDHNGVLSSYVSVFADITETKDSEHKLWQLAHHDALSNLPNRLLLNARLEHAMQRAHRTSGGLALLFIDLDRFKNINDSLGHQVGDELLCKIAARLRAAVHEDDTVARLGGDEFVVLLDDVAEPNDARRIAERIIERISEPVSISGRSLVTTASLGISLYPGDAQDPNTLLKHADAAMYRAKTQGRNRIAYYAPELTDEIRQRLELEHDLRLGIARQEFSLHYQPQFSTGDGRLIAVEALLRWNHPERGMVPPATFISIAEETGLIRELGCWVTETACRQGREWLDKGLPPFTIAVNLSPYQLRGDCAAYLRTIFERTGFPPEWFEFEVTETLLVEDGGHALRQLAEMRRQLGMHIAMDDFGTGHSSLSQLKLLPIGKLKIDRSFVMGLPDSSDDTAIVKAIILMAHTLGLQVVAEGVETMAQWQLLCDAGCDHVQGFLFGRPMPAEDLSDLLDRGQIDITARIYEDPGPRP